MSKTTMNIVDGNEIQNGDENFEADREVRVFKSVTNSLSVLRLPI